MPNNENNTKRGLHLILIDPLTGKVEQSHIFDTYHSSLYFEKFIANNDIAAKQGENQNCIPAGKIIVATCKDDFVNSLS